jgi:hypothetical protein
MVRQYSDPGEGLVRVGWLRIGLAASFAVLAACTSSTDAPGRPKATGPSGSQSDGAHLASGRPLPGRCDNRQAEPSQTVAFVADGRAWALDPSSGALTCLFRVADPGPFSWGPLGDRVLLDGLHMEAIGGQTLQAPLDVQPGPSAWGHPVGTAVAFVSGDGTELEKRYLDQRGVVDISPLDGASYLSVTYHPSGLALAFVVEREGRQSIWLSSNLGEDPKRLVFSSVGTEFGALEFSPDGRTLVYAAQHADGHPEVLALDLANRSFIRWLWKGQPGQRVLSVFQPPSRRERFLGLTLGTSCEDSTAMVRGPDRKLIPVLPDGSRPSRVLGWLDRTHVLVGAGGCGEALDLSSFDVRSDASVLLVSGVTAAASRAPAPPAPSSLPKEVEGEVGSGVG